MVCMSGQGGSRRIQVFWKMNSRLGGGRWDLFADPGPRPEHEILTCYQVKYDGSTHLTLQNLLCSNSFFFFSLISSYQSLECLQFKRLSLCNLDENSPAEEWLREQGCPWVMEARNNPGPQSLWTALIKNWQQRTEAVSKAIQQKAT